MFLLFLALGFLGIRAIYAAVELPSRDAVSAAYLLAAALFSGLCFLAAAVSYAGESIAKALKAEEEMQEQEASDRKRFIRPRYKGPAA